MSFLESGNNVTAFASPVQELGGIFLQREIENIFPTAYASSTSDYSQRSPMTQGDNLGILLSSATGILNQPIQETSTGVDIVNTNTGFHLYFTSKDTLSGTGYMLGTPLQISMNNG